MAITFAQMKEHRRRGTFYNSQMHSKSNKSVGQEAQNSPKARGDKHIASSDSLTLKPTDSPRAKAGLQQVKKQVTTPAMPPMEVSDEPTFPHRQQSYSPRSPRRHSPPFAFQHSSRLPMPRSSIEKGGTMLMKSIDRASPIELKQFLKSTLLAQ